MTGSQKGAGSGYRQEAAAIGRIITSMQTAAPLIEAAYHDTEMHLSAYSRERGEILSSKKSSGSTYSPRPAPAGLTKKAAEDLKRLNGRIETAAANIGTYKTGMGQSPDIEKSLRGVQNALPKVDDVNGAHSVIMIIETARTFAKRLSKTPEPLVSERYGEIAEKLGGVETSLRDKFKRVGFTEEYERTH